MSNPEKSQQQPEVQPAMNQAAPVQKRWNSGGNWVLGLAVAVIGGLLLARNLGVELFFLDLHNWWAFFILLAAIGPLQQAFSFYRKEGMGVAVVNSLVSAGTIIFISLMFLLDLSFWTWWPVFVIIGGLYMMTNRSSG